MNERNLTRLFNPRSIAILGASRDEKKIGHIVLKNIVNSGFRGKIYPVNPNTASLEGMACYTDYKDLPEVPDLAILSLPAEIAVSLLEPIAKKGTKNIVIFSVGFKEVGPRGKELENKLHFVAEKYKLNILGPNCLGFISASSNLNSTFSQTSGVSGNLRFISQSGALASGIFDWAKHYQVGFSEFITLGNKTVLNENDILRYWLTQTNKQIIPADLSGYRPIGMYLESIDAGKEFLNLVSKISITDPIFILKPGKSKEAQQAMQSHTGSMAGDSAVQDVAFKQAGVIRCDGLEDMFDLAKIFSWVNAPTGPRVAIVSNAGGPAVVSVDALEKEGLELAIFSTETHQKLKNKLPAAASIMNPVDVMGDALANRYIEAISSALSDKGVDALLVILTPQVMTETDKTAEVIGKLARQHQKPVICSFIGGETIEKGEAILNKYKIPSFRFPERAIKALAKMWQWRFGVESRKLKVKSKIIKPLTKNTINKINNLIKFAKIDNREALTSLESNKVLNLCGIKTPKFAIVKNISEAKKFADANGWPVVLKISSSELLHKTDRGGVVINIENPTSLARAWEKINRTASGLSKRSSHDIFIQKQIIGGLEVIAGIKYDKSFGNVLMFGAGGVLAELLADTNIKLLPLDKRGVMGLISDSKIGKILNGYRGKKSYATKNIVRTIVKLGNLAENVPFFEELEINPIIITEKDAWAVDGRIILNSTISL